MIFYIIFGTNLLSKGPVLVPVSVFSIFLSLAEKEYQTEFKRNKTSRCFFLHQKTPRRLGVQVRRATRRREGWRARPRGAPPTLWDPRDSSDLDLCPMNSDIFQNHQTHPRKHFSTATTFCSREIPSWGIFRHPAGGGIDHAGLVHQHHCPSDEA